MSIADARKAGPPSASRACKVRTVLAGLPPSEADELRAMIADPDWNSAEISRALSDEGFVVSRERIRIHRVGDCSCP